MVQQSKSTYIIDLSSLKPASLFSLLINTTSSVCLKSRLHYTWDCAFAHVCCSFLIEPTVRTCSSLAIKKKNNNCFKIIFFRKAFSLVIHCPWCKDLLVMFIQIIGGFYCRVFALLDFCLPCFLHRRKARVIW